MFCSLLGALSAIVVFLQNEPTCSVRDVALLCLFLELLTYVLFIIFLLCIKAMFSQKHCQCFLHYIILFCSCGIIGNDFFPSVNVVLSENQLFILLYILRLCYFGILMTC